MTHTPNQGRTLDDVLQALGCHPGDMVVQNPEVFFRSGASFCGNCPDVGRPDRRPPEVKNHVALCRA